MAKNYHNTTNLSGSELEEATEKSITQKQIIHDLFKQFPDKKTPFDVSVILVKNGYKYPITSIRARLNALTNENYLVKSVSADHMGLYNARNHTWHLSTHDDNNVPPELTLDNN